MRTLAMAGLVLASCPAVMGGCGRSALVDGTDENPIPQDAGPGPVDLDGSFDASFDASSDASPLDEAGVDSGPCVPEWCNGRDDDCDGSVDEDPEASESCDLPHAFVVCEGGECRFDSCDDGWGDCNADPADGCETSLDSLEDCGGCGLVCDLPNGTESCESGACAIGECDEGFEDCDGRPGNGCEPLHTFFADADGDGHGVSDDSVIACAAPEGYVASNRDCHDENADANPDQERWFTTDRGDGSFDFDCDESETRRWDALAGRFMMCGWGVCSIAPGWDGVVPECGVTGTFVERCEGCPSPYRVVVERTQECR